MNLLNPQISQPIHHPAPWGLHDVQQDPPAAWCIVCGMEVYQSDRVLCPECGKEKENEMSIPLPRLQPGTRPSGMRKHPM